LRLTTVEIAGGSFPRAQALLETADDPFHDLIAKVVNVVGGNDCLNVGREPSSTRLEIDALIRKVHFNSTINEVPKAP
jgi:hypothetical protein